MTKVDPSPAQSESKYFAYFINKEENTIEKVSVDFYHVTMPRKAKDSDEVPSDSPSEPENGGMTKKGAPVNEKPEPDSNVMDAPDNDFAEDESETDY